MNHKERMLSEKLYKANDSNLWNEREFASSLFYEFNNCQSNEINKMDEILRKLFGSSGKNIRVKPPFHCDYGYNIHVGDSFFANYNCIILDVAPVYIGNNVKLAPNVSIFTAAHPIHPTVRVTDYEFGIQIRIGDNVWIGGNTVINPGVFIGENCVIGSGSVVCNDIPANCVAAGNPCKVIRPITDADLMFYFDDRKIDI